MKFCNCGKEVEMISQNSEYGECFCKEIYTSQLVDIRMTVDEKLVVLQNVPQGNCPGCGSRVYTASTLETIEAVKRGWQHDPCLSKAHI
jgi:YgiT-type zinc finger domain-containing protein